VLLLMGLGMQLIAWPPAFVGPGQRRLPRGAHRQPRHRPVAALRPPRQPNLLWQSMKRAGPAGARAYSLKDMAQDALGVLDVLHIPQAHVVGVSMGGMIAQRMALAAPDRLLSLTSIMSSSGARQLPGPRSDVLRALVNRPADSSEAAVVDHAVRLFKLIGSPSYPLDDKVLRDAVRASMKRSFHPAGSQRQMLAVIADLTRADELARIKLPTLVVHGRDDPLVPYACGVDTARRIAGSRLVAIPAWAMTFRQAWSSACWPLLPHLQLGSSMNSPNSRSWQAGPYRDQYDARLLFPLSRAPKREEIGIAGAPPFFGADLWTAFELSWLNPRGKPQVAIAHFTVPCETPNIIESKSLKLYLGSFTPPVSPAPTTCATAARRPERGVWRGAPARHVGVRLLLPDRSTGAGA
jgi:NADPH-dependent 7-cyano-7-deazaguanine reductase QueF-like protein/pimeloyl-ACP methyl ester carboxylesterase